ncbi:unnamed protein product [Closterium sp. Naga37s-1]|nr:unnamed protein product [Closterium sp. Naga37s-1]
MAQSARHGNLQNQPSTAPLSHSPVCYSGVTGGSVMGRFGTHFLMFLLCSALFTAAASASLLTGSFLPRDDGRITVPLASTTQVAMPQQLQKKNFAKYVAKLRPTKYDNRLVVGDKGASGIFVAKGIRAWGGE